MALLSGLLGGSANNGFLTRMGLLGTPTADPLAASLDPIYYSAGDDRASRISQALHAASAAFTNPPKGRGDLGVLANLANSIGPAYKENNYLNEAIGRQTKSNMLFEEQRKKQLGEEEDLQWADIIAQHPELANMGRAEARKVLADMFEQKQGISRGGADVYTPKYVRVPNTDPKTQAKYPFVWQEHKIGTRGQQDIVTDLPLGSEPQGDPNLLAERAGKQRSAQELSKLNSPIFKSKMNYSVTVAVQNSDRAAKQIEALYNDPGLSQILGIQGMFNNAEGIRALNSGDAARAYGLYQSIISQSVVDTLTAMRRASEHGGAFGNVTDYENKLLAAKTGLEQAQTPEDFQRALGQLLVDNQNAKAALERYYNGMYPDEPFEPLPSAELPATMKPKTGGEGGNTTHGGEGGGGGGRRRYNPETQSFENY